VIKFENIIAEREARLRPQSLVPPDMGRPALSLEVLLATEKLVRAHGHRPTAAQLGITYHAVRHRMRRLLTLRGIAIGKQGSKIKPGEI
jgi:hypothetical protein